MLSLELLLGLSCFYDDISYCLDASLENELSSAVCLHVCVSSRILLTGTSVRVGVCAKARLARCGLTLVQRMCLAEAGTWGFGCLCLICGLQPALNSLPLALNVL